MGGEGLDAAEDAVQGALHLLGAKGEEAEAEVVVEALSREGEEVEVEEELPVQKVAVESLHMLGICKGEGGEGVGVGVGVVRAPHLLDVKGEDVEGPQEVVVRALRCMKVEGVVEEEVEAEVAEACARALSPL